MKNVLFLISMSLLVQILFMTVWDATKVEAGIVYFASLSAFMGIANFFKTKGE